MYKYEVTMTHKHQQQRLSIVVKAESEEAAVERAKLESPWLDIDTEVENIQFMGEVIEEIKSYSLSSVEKKLDTLIEVMQEMLACVKGTNTNIDSVKRQIDRVNDSMHELFDEDTESVELDTISRDNIGEDIDIREAD